MYVSYLMGAEHITDKELLAIGADIVGKTESGSRKLKIPLEFIETYKDLIREKLDSGFWNEFLDENTVHFIFKKKDGEIEEHTLSPENEAEIGRLCSELNGDPREKTANVYKYISDNDFYRDFMMGHYREMIER